MVGSRFTSRLMIALEFCSCGLESRTLNEGYKLRPAVGAGLPRPPPIYRPPAEGAWPCLTLGRWRFRQRLTIGGEILRSQPQQPPLGSNGGYFGTWLTRLARQVSKSNGSIPSGMTQTGSLSTRPLVRTASGRVQSNRSDCQHHSVQETNGGAGGMQPGSGERPSIRSREGSIRIVSIEQPWVPKDTSRKSF